MESQWPHSHTPPVWWGQWDWRETREDGSCTHSPGDEGEKGGGCRVKIMMDLTGLYPIATEHAAVVEALGGRYSDLTKVRFWFNMYSQSLLKKEEFNNAHHASESQHHVRINLGDICRMQASIDLLMSV